jgi:hypothetical protein
LCRNTIFAGTVLAVAKDERRSPGPGASWFAPGREIVMRRSAATLLLLGLFLAGAPPGPAHAQSHTRAAEVCIFDDPGTIVGVTVWAILQVSRLMQLGDELADHFKEDVRRAQEHPQVVPPQVAPVPQPVHKPVFPNLEPSLRRSRPPSARPAPIIDTLPARPTS